MVEKMIMNLINIRMNIVCCLWIWCNFRHYNEVRNIGILLWKGWSSLLGSKVEEDKGKIVYVFLTILFK